MKQLANFKIFLLAVILLGSSAFGLGYYSSNNDIVDSNDDVDFNTVQKEETTEDVKQPVEIDSDETADEQNITVTLTPAQRTSYQTVTLQNDELRAANKAIILHDLVDGSLLPFQINVDTQDDWEIVSQHPSTIQSTIGAEIIEFYRSGADSDFTGVIAYQDPTDGGTYRISTDDKEATPLSGPIITEKGTLQYLFTSFDNVISYTPTGFDNSIGSVELMEDEVTLRTIDPTQNIFTDIRVPLTKSLADQQYFFQLRSGEVLYTPGVADASFVYVIESGETTPRVYFDEQEYSAAGEQIFRNHSSVASINLRSGLSLGEFYDTEDTLYMYSSVERGREASYSNILTYDKQSGEFGIALNNNYESDRNELQSDYVLRLPLVADLDTLPQFEVETTSPLTINLSDYDMMVDPRVEFALTEDEKILYNELLEPSFDDTHTIPAQWSSSQVNVIVAPYQPLAEGPRMRNFTEYSLGNSRLSVVPRDGIVDQGLDRSLQRLESIISEGVVTEFINNDLNRDEPRNLPASYILEPYRYSGPIIYQAGLSQALSSDVYDGAVLVFAQQCYGACYYSWEILLGDDTSFYKYSTIDTILDPNAQIDANRDFESRLNECEDVNCYKDIIENDDRLQSFKDKILEQARIVEVIN